MIIDSHEHLMLPTTIQLSRMDAAGIDKTLLFCSTPHPEKAENLSQLQNELQLLYQTLEGGISKEGELSRMKQNIQDIVAVIATYPNRFDGFGCVPLFLSLPDTIDWIQTYIISNQLKGVGEFTPGNEEQILALNVIFQALTHFPHYPIWVHTFHPVSLQGIYMLADLAKAYPTVPVIFGHMGGYHWMKLIEIAKTIPNMYLDLSAMFSTLAAQMAIKELPDRCLFSSDAPYGDPLISRQLIEFVSPSQEVSAMVLGGTIAKLIDKQKSV